MPVFRNVKSLHSLRLDKEEAAGYNGNGPAPQARRANREATLTIPPSPRSSATPPPEPQEASYPGHKGKKPGHVRRPRNAFIFFRSNFYEEQKLYSTEIDQNDISRRAGQRWKSLSDEEKEPFRLLAENEKVQHQAMFPDYSYAPGNRKGKSKSKSKPQQQPIASTTVVVAPIPIKTEIPWSFPWDGKDTSCYAPKLRLITPGSEDEQGIVGGDFAGQSLPQGGFFFPEMPGDSVQEQNDLFGHTLGSSYHDINPQFGGQPVHHAQEVVEPVSHLPSSDTVSVHGDWDFISQTLASYDDFAIENSWLSTIGGAELGPSLYPSNPGLFDEVPPPNLDGGDIFQYLNFNPYSH